MMPIPKQVMCNFCKRNKEPESVYRNHELKDHLGNVVCPQLFKYRCELCGSTGKEAHTRSYCPSISNLRNMNQQRHNQAAHQSSSDHSDAGSAKASGLHTVRGGMFRNMGKVTNSRYNSAGKLRNPQLRHELKQERAQYQQHQQYQQYQQQQYQRFQQYPGMHQDQFQSAAFQTRTNIPSASLTMNWTWNAQTNQYVGNTPAASLRQQARVNNPNFDFDSI